MGTYSEERGWVAGDADITVGVTTRSGVRGRPHQQAEWQWWLEPELAGQGRARSGPAEERERSGRVRHCLGHS